MTNGVAVGIVGVEIGSERAYRRRFEQLGGDPEAPLERDAAPRGGQLVFRRDQDEIPVLAEVGIDAELVTKTLVGDDAVRRQLDAETVRILMADAAAGEGRRAGAHGVALEDGHAPRAEPRQMVRRADAHDAGADDHDLCGFRHLIPSGIASTLSESPDDPSASTARPPVRSRTPPTADRRRCVCPPPGARATPRRRWPS